MSTISTPSSPVKASSPLPLRRRHVQIELKGFATSTTPGSPAKSAKSSPAAAASASSSSSSSSTAAAPGSPSTAGQQSSAAAIASAVYPLLALDESPKGSRAPANWQATYSAIAEMRKNKDAPVDTVGCASLADTKTDPPTQRFQTLIALLLSSQTKDPITAKAMVALQKHGLTPARIVATDEKTISALITPVSFLNRKATYMRETSKILLEKYGGDIPNTVESLCELPGIGPKMAHLAMQHAWNINSGIGVDVHVHRIADRLHWTKKSKHPEDTRRQLQEWVPKSLWQSVNTLLVGFGQTICAFRPKCDTCLARDLCPASKGFLREINKKEKSKPNAKSKSKSKSLTDAGDSAAAAAAAATTAAATAREGAKSESAALEVDAKPETAAGLKSESKPNSKRKRTDTKPTSAATDSAATTATEPPIDPAPKTESKSKSKSKLRASGSGSGSGSDTSGKRTRKRVKTEPESLPAATAAAAGDDSIRVKPEPISPSKPPQSQLVESAYFEASSDTASLGHRMSQRRRQSPKL